MATQLLCSHHGSALVLTLSDPATRNALSREVYAAGTEALQAAAQDPQVRCIILRGEGASFCAGGNLQRILGVRALGEEPGRATQEASIDLLSGWIQAIADCPKPVMAAVEGFAAGAGASLALACDLVLAAEDARFVMSYGKVGFSPDGGGSWQLGRMLPRPLALKALWLAQALTPQELLAHGAVTAVCPTGEALATALEWSTRLAAMAPNVLASAKRLVYAAPQQTLQEHLQQERRHFVDNLFHANGLEGPTAFLEKRPARFV